MLKNKLATPLFALGMMLTGGLIAGVTTIASAQTTSTTTVSPGTTTAAPSTSSAAEATEPKTHGHAPLGGDGVVTSVNGSTVVVGEESDEGGAAYTVDASKATVTVNGAAGSLSDVKVGGKIFVQGTVNGTSVVATSISIGHPGGHADKANGTDGGAANEASEPAGSSDAADQ